MKTIKILVPDSFASKMIFMQVNNTFNKLTKKVDIESKGYFKQIIASILQENICIEFSNETTNLNFSSFSEKEVRELIKYIKMLGGNCLIFYFSENKNVINKIEVCQEIQK